MTANKKDDLLNLELVEFKELVWELATLDNAALLLQNISSGSYHIKTALSSISSRQKALAQQINNLG